MCVQEGVQESVVLSETASAEATNLEAGNYNLLDLFVTIYMLHCYTMALRASIFAVLNGEKVNVIHHYSSVTRSHKNNTF